MKVIDRVLPISGPDAIRCSKDLAAQKGIFVGITSGATFAGALKIAAEAEKGANILCMLHQTAEGSLPSSQQRLPFSPMSRMRRSPPSPLQLRPAEFSSPRPVE
jgi:cysteine synthase A